MIKKWIFVIIFFMYTPCSVYVLDISSFKFQSYNRQFVTKEEFYSLYRENLYHKESNFNANLFWLEHALKAPFAIPVLALAKIESQKQWDEYKVLFLFHIEFLMMQNYLNLAMQYDKPNILFFNSIFKKEIKEGLQIAEIYNKRALLHLNKALKLARKAWKERYNNPSSLSSDTDKWMDTVYRILHINIYHRMNYSKEINLRLNNIKNKLSQVENLKSPANS